MTALLVAAIVFALVFGGAMAGLALNARLPEHHRDASSKDVVTLVMGLIATVSALVLSLLIASAHDQFDTQEREVQQLSVHTFQLDRLLAHYGPETVDVRELLRRFVADELRQLWPGEGVDSAKEAAAPVRVDAEDLYMRIAGLAPKTQIQRFVQSHALELLASMGQTRRLMLEQAGGSLSTPFFVVLVFWLVVLFVGFGLFARRNATVVAALVAGALTVAGAVFLILEMNTPYSGMMAISSAPMRTALDRIGR